MRLILGSGPARIVPTSAFMTLSTFQTKTWNWCLDQIFLNYFTFIIIFKYGHKTCSFIAHDEFDTPVTILRLFSKLICCTTLSESSKFKTRLSATHARKRDVWRHFGVSLWQHCEILGSLWRDESSLVWEPQEELESVAAEETSCSRCLGNPTIEKQKTDGLKVWH